MVMLKRWVGNLSLILGGLIVGVLILEIGLRIGGISYPSFRTTDQHLGWALRPNSEGWNCSEGEAYVRINSDGLRYREHSKVKPANTLRIAVLGDSFAAALQVPMEKTFWAVMEQELEGCKALAGRKVEAINFGVDGYGTAQELLTLRHRAWDYDPDIVVLAFLAGNDISDNSRALDGDSVRPYFVYHGGRLVLDASFIESPAYRARQTWFARLGYRLINYSRVLQLVNKVKIVLQERYRATQERDLVSNDVIVEPGLVSAIYLEPNDPDWEEAWRVTEGLIVLMRDEVAEKGADFGCHSR